jgi:hypothetical protein
MLLGDFAATCQQGSDAPYAQIALLDCGMRFSKVRICQQRTEYVPTYVMVRTLCTYVRLGLGALLDGRLSSVSHESLSLIYRIADSSSSASLPVHEAFPLSRCLAASSFSPPFHQHYERTLQVRDISKGSKV